MPTKEQILAEIRRTADANGGIAPGRSRFAAETGIREHDWSGRYWARWSDAVAEAGYAPNELQARYDDEAILAKLAAEIRRLGHMPTTAELRLRRRDDPDFPSHGVFQRIGSKAILVQRVGAFCAERPEWSDVAAIIDPLVTDDLEPPPVDSTRPDRFGFVYLLKSGKHYKIGHTFDVGRRKYELAIQLPEPVQLQHEIRTDDPVGIERYWHQRFEDCRLNGEWFQLSQADVAAFRRRKFM